MRHIDMTKVWTGAHGCCCLRAIVDCCTRGIPGWSLELRCRDEEAIAVVEHAVFTRAPCQLAD
jgi:putative transposase